MRENASEAEETAVYLVGPWYEPSNVFDNDSNLKMSIFDLGRPDCTIKGAMATLATNTCCLPCGPSCWPSSHSLAVQSSPVILKGIGSCETAAVNVGLQKAEAPQAQAT
jgi:hypothetical protein